LGIKEFIPFLLEKEPQINDFRVRSPKESCDNGLFPSISHVFPIHQGHSSVLALEDLKKPMTGTQVLGGSPSGWEPRFHLGGMGVFSPSFLGILPYTKSRLFLEVEN
jgi:hypothetical protein